MHVICYDLTKFTSAILEAVCSFNNLRPDFTSNLVYGLAFEIPKFYIAPYDKINSGLVKLSSNCDVKSGLRLHFPENAHFRMKLFVMYKGLRYMKASTLRNLIFATAGGLSPCRRTNHGAFGTRVMFSSF